MTFKLSSPALITGSILGDTPAKATPTSLVGCAAGNKTLISSSTIPMPDWRR
jgi:hypothetical protein